MKGRFSFSNQILVIMALVLLFSTFLYSKGKKDFVLPPLDSKKTFIIGYLEGEDTPLLDPFVANDELSLLILEGLYEGLYRIDGKTGDPILAIAQKVDVSNDGLIWTFTLHNDALFSNYDPITAKTFIKSWLHLLESANQKTEKSYLVSLFDVVEGAKEYRQGTEKKDSIGIYEKSEYQIEIHLNNKAPYLPALLANVTFAAIHPDSFKNGIHPLITSGAYSLKEIDEEHVILEKNRYYRDAQLVKSDYIEILIKDEKGAIESYLDKSAQWILAYVPIQLLRNKEDLHLQQTYSTGFFYFSAKEGPYSDSRVRKAISLITPWDEIRANSGQPFPSKTLIPLTTSHTVEKTYIEGESEREALSLLSEAGYESFSSLPPLNIAVHRGAPIQETASQLAIIWATNLEIPIIVDTVPLSLYSRYPRENPYDLSYITWAGDFKDPFAFLPLFSSASTYNIANYSNVMYDNLLEKALKSNNEIERNGYIETAQDILLEDAIIFPIHSGFSLHVIDTSSVRGWYDNSINIHPLRDLERINL